MKDYPVLDYMHGKHKPRIVGPVLGKYRVEIVTTWDDKTIAWTSCPHLHRTKRSAERCLWRWNDFAHDEREKILRAGRGSYY